MMREPATAFLRFTGSRKWTGTAPVVTCKVPIHAARIAAERARVCGEEHMRRVVEDAAAPPSMCRFAGACGSHGVTVSRVDELMAHGVVELVRAADEWSTGTIGACPLLRAGA